VYRTNPEETKEIQRQVQELLNNGYVCESLSPCVVPVILVPKKNGTSRMCVDCRAINNITIHYRFPIPRLDDVIPHSEIAGTKPPYVCPGCFIHTYSHNMINRFHVR
jgi:hypothetical protein